MKKRKLLMILGAGASKPYGFPTGKELLKQVQNTRLETEFENISLELGVYDSQFKAFNNDLMLSGMPSIDAFLENNSQYIKVGKIVIAYFLIRYEDYANLYNLSIEDNWYQYLIDKMLRNYPFSAIEANQVSFITYNYDRSLEFYLYNAFKRSNSSITDEQSFVKLSNFPVVHLHGSLGPPDQRQLEFPGNDN